jgi:hypothetical protein
MIPPIRSYVAGYHLPQTGQAVKPHCAMFCQAWAFRFEHLYLSLDDSQLLFSLLEILSVKGKTHEITGI